VAKEGFTISKRSCRECVASKVSGQPKINETINTSILPKVVNLQRLTTFFMLLRLLCVRSTECNFLLRVLSTTVFPVRVFSRVGKGISAQAAHRTVRESLPSYGSCYPVMLLLPISSDETGWDSLSVSPDTF
jgi:hypothetical protein